MVSARRLRPYFQSHPIIVLTDHPLRLILQKPEASGRLTKWSIELSEFDITYRPRPSIKAQVLADFVSEFTRERSGTDRPVPIEQETPAINAPIGQQFDPSIPVWQLYVDGASNAHGSGAGLILITPHTESPDTSRLECALRFDFKASNNEAEYEALLAGLRLASDMGARQLQAFSDSQLIVNQVTGDYLAKDPTMCRYVTLVKDLMIGFSCFKLTKVPRGENQRADALARIASAIDPNPGGTVPIVILEQRSTETTPTEVNHLRLEETNWMTPILEYLRDGSLPRDNDEAKKVRFRSSRYLIINNHLYRRAHSMPYLRCLGPSESRGAIREVHEGICGHHPGGRAMAHKLVRLGYYWPTLLRDAVSFTRQCKSCQFNAPNVPKPSQPLETMVNPCPFAQWGLDLIGPMPKGTGGVEYVVVATDYSTKWTEAKALKSITSQQIQTFVWENIICRFGVPQIIVTDNGRQFDSNSFREFCQCKGITLSFASVAHPQTNGQVEAVNKILKRTMRTKLGERKGAWPELLPEVLWAYRTSYKAATGETPFSLAFGAEAVVPVEINSTTHRIDTFDPNENEEQLCLNRDLLEERREQANLRNAEHKNRLKRKFDAKAKVRHLKQGDWVLRRVRLSTKDSAAMTFNQRWEGPYRVLKVVKPGTYRLMDPTGYILPHPWNVEHLRYYYP